MLIDKLVDRCVTDETPPFMSDVKEFRFVAIDKDKSYEFANYYRSSKTYAKVIVTGSSDPEFLDVHYFRSCKRTDVESKNTPISDQMIDRLYVAATHPIDIPKKASLSMEYYRARLDLLRNELEHIRSSPLAPALGPTAAEEYKVPLVDVGPEYFFDASNGVEAVGILKTPTAT